MYGGNAGIFCASRKEAESLSLLCADCGLVACMGRAVSMGGGGLWCLFVCEWRDPAMGQRVYAYHLLDELGAWDKV